MYFLFLTIMNLKYIIIPSKRDTQSQRSLKTWSRAGYKLSADLSRVTPEQKTVLRV